MEIGPVQSVRLAPRIAPPVQDSLVPEAIEVFSTAFAAEETYTPSVLRAGAGAEEVEDDAFENEAVEETGGQAGRRKRISYFV